MQCSCKNNAVIMVQCATLDTFGSDSQNLGEMQYNRQLFYNISAY